MITLRESNLVKFICVILASTFFMISCSEEILPIQNNCSVPLEMDIDQDKVVKLFEDMLNYAETVEYQENYTNYADYHRTLYGNNVASDKYINTFETEGVKYTQLGFDSYVDQIISMSSNLKSYYINYSQELSTFLTTEHPDLAQFSSFLDSQKSLVKSSELCENDQKNMLFYLSLSQGYGNWYYQNYYNGELGEISARGCNFWGAIGCGLLAIVVGAVVATVVTVVIVLAASVSVNGTPVDDDTAATLGLIAGIALGIHVGINIYEWCCGMEEVEEQECLPPTGSSYINTGCNEFAYRIFGPSKYGVTEWGNIENECIQSNTDPLAAQTSTARIIFSGPDFGSPSTICAFVSCLSDPTTLDFYTNDENLIFESDVDYFPLTWTEVPPSTYIYQEEANGPVSNNLIFATVNTPMNDVIEYNWSINSPHSIQSGGGINNNFIVIEVNDSSTFLTTNLSATNICTNETLQLLAQTQIL